jgi:dihydroflavonol-4-reductase
LEKPLSSTVLVTGATGYIARHIIRRLLDRGHTVVGTTRDASRDAEMRAALEPVLADRSSLERYRTVSLDLLRYNGWGSAMEGVDTLIHTASPFPISSPKNADDVVRPAVDGTLRALRAAQAAGIANVVLTSSSVAVTETSDHRDIYDETCWTDPQKTGLSPYALSKTLAERAAWEFVSTDARGMRLSVINPTFVLGAPLGSDFGTSIKVIERLMRGTDPMLPRFGFACCDVGDVAEAHVRAMDRSEAAGRRHIIYDRFMWLEEIASVIRDAAPSARPARRVAPDVLMRLVGVFDPAVRGIVPQLGKITRADNSRMREALGLEPRDTRDSVAETARWLTDRKAA